MRPHVQVEVVSPRLLAAVRREVAAGRVGEGLGRSALHQVWAFLRGQPGPAEKKSNRWTQHLRVSPARQQPVIR